MKIALIIAFKNFRDEEYFIPKEIFEKNGAEIKTVSLKKGIAIGSQGGEAKVDLKIDELNISDFDAIVFIGGQGAAENINNGEFHQVAKKAIKENKILGAICIAPAILAKAGVLKDRKATVWTSFLDKSAVKILEENGVVYEDSAVVTDGKIITANGPGASKEFGEKIIGLLTGK